MTRTTGTKIGRPFILKEQEAQSIGRQGPAPALMLIVVLAPASPAEGAETETRTSTRVTLPSFLRPMLVPTTAATALAAAAPAGAEERSRPQISMRAMLLMLLERALLAVVAAVVPEAAEGSQRLTTIHGTLPVGLV